MVLQRDAPIPIWGEAAPNETVSVAIATQKVSAKADANGAWRLQLAPLAANATPQTLTILGSAPDYKPIQISDVLVGEVWLCGGQSNMSEPQSASLDAKAESASGANPLLREFLTPRTASAEQIQRFSGGAWKVATKQTIPTFSATAYYFGQRLQKQLGVPVGLVNASVGATRIDSWISREAFASDPRYKKTLAGLDALQTQYEKDVAAHEAAKLALAPGAAAPTPPKYGTGSKNDLTSLYNGMIAPSAGYAIKGALWYQGEANRGDGPGYFNKLKLLIESYRATWKQGDFPFYVVQIAPYSYKGNVERSGEIQEAQAQTLTLPNTGLVVTMDIGDLTNIHPRRKREVGERLANLALAKIYKQDVGVVDSPLLASFAVEGAKIRLKFSNTGGALKASDDQPLSWFQIAAADGNFVPATATIEGESVVVSSPEVVSPAHVRFAWDNSAQPNLVNAAGLPASAFRTNSPFLAAK